jgi:hypothetical protein
MAEASRFARATMGGNPVGRPRTSPPPPGRVASALIAASRWQQKRGLDQRDTVPRSAQSGADIAAARGQWRAERRFDDERGFFSPDSAANGGTGTSARNPWT